MQHQPNSVESPQQRRGIVECEAAGFQFQLRGQRRDLRRRDEGRDEGEGDVRGEVRDVGMRVVAADAEFRQIMGERGMVKAK